MLTDAYEYSLRQRYHLLTQPLLAEAWPEASMLSMRAYFYRLPARP